MKRTRLALGIIAAIMCCYCEDEPKIKDFDSPKEYLQNPSVSSAINESGQVINRENNPPLINGRYNAASSSLRVSQTLMGPLPPEVIDVSIYGQRSEGLIEICECSILPGIFPETHAGGCSPGFITGSGSQFTTWRETSLYIGSSFLDVAIINTGNVLDNNNIQARRLVICLKTLSTVYRPGFWYSSDLFLTYEGEGGLGCWD